MDAMSDKDGSSVLPIIIHGDAAFAGQGVVYVVTLLLEHHLTRNVKPRKKIKHQHQHRQVRNDADGETSTLSHGWYSAYRVQQSNRIYV